MSRLLEMAGAEPTHEFKKPQPLGLRFRALLTDRGAERFELARVQGEGRILL